MIQFFILSVHTYRCLKMKYKEIIWICMDIVLEMDMVPIYMWIHIYGYGPLEFTYATLVKIT